MSTILLVNCSQKSINNKSTVSSKISPKNINSMFFSNPGADNVRMRALLVVENEFFIHLKFQTGKTNDIYIPLLKNAQM